MPRNHEPLISNSGETLWPVEDIDGLRYMRSVDVAVLATEKPEDRRARVADFIEAIMASDDDNDDPIGNYSG